MLPVLFAIACLFLACSSKPPLPGADRMSAGHGSEQNPCLLPGDGDLVYTRFENGYNEGPSAVLRVDLSSDEERVLIEAGESDHVNLPGRCASPDGGLLAVSSDDEDRDEIWLLDLASDQVSRLTWREGTVNYEPAFAMDGSTVVFESEGQGDPARIFRIGIDGTGETALTGTGSHARQPNPSPVEDTVVFQSDAGGTWGLWTVPLSGGDPVVLLDSDAEETDASYSSDGSVVVFATDDCSGLSCIAVLKDGVVELVAEAEGWYLGAPSMAADGTVYFEACKGDPDEGRDTAVWRL